MKYVMQNKYMKGVITVYLDSDTELNNCKKVWLCNFQIQWNQDVKHTFRKKHIQG